MALTAFGINCTLSAPDQPSSTQLLLDQLMAALGEHGVTGDTVRARAHEIKPGVSSDEGDGDDWPALHDRILDADIFVLATPIWVGNPSSVCRRVLERCDALLSETDDEGRLIATGKVAIGAVVGNEDGAHNVSAQIFQGLNDIGFSVPANGVTYWVGEAMHGTDYRELPDTPEAVAATTAMAARNAAHLARLLQTDDYPPS